MVGMVIECYYVSVVLVRISIDKFNDHTYSNILLQQAYFLHKNHSNVLPIEHVILDGIGKL